MASLAVDENICKKDAFSRNQSGDSDYKVTDACNQQSDSSASRSNTRSPASTALVSESLAKRKIGLDTTDYTVITEGKAELLFTKGTKNFLNVDVTASPAFNQVRAFGRDFTIAVIKQFSWKNFERKKAQSYTSDNDFVPGEYWEDGITIFGGHSASGLRSIRYALEVPGIRQVLLNDSSDVGRETVDDIRLNVRHNSVEHLVQYSQSDPRAFLFRYITKKDGEKLDVIDLDQSGNTLLYLDTAVQALNDGGLLCVTFTDTALLCGNGAESCFAKYGGMSLKAKCCHEMALRLLLNCIESHAAQYSRYTVPVLCMSADFCLRVFVKIYTSAEHANSTASKRALVYQCTGCETFNLQHMGKISTNDQNNTMYKNSAGPPVSLACRHCSYPHHLGGPIWAEPLYETTFLTGMIQNIQDHWDALKSSKRIIGMLTMMMEELQDAPLYYVLDKICSVVQVPAPKIIKVRSALLHAGFRVSGSHCNQGAIKTDAPSDTIWDIVRCLAREEGKPIKPKLRSQAEVILSKEPSFKANFEKHPDADPISKRRGQKLQTTPDTKKRQPDMSDVVIEKHDGDSIDGASKPKQSQGKKRKKKKQANPDFLKRFPCKKYKRGECTLGETCRYSHDLDKVSRVKPAGTEQTEEQPDLKAENNSDVRAGAEHGDYEPMLTDNPNFLNDNPQNFQAF